MGFGDEVIEIRIIGTNVVFRTNKFGSQFTDISGLRLSHSGVIKEFPDLKDNNEWRKIACERFKDKIKKLNSEKERINYIIEDLTKFGYVLRYIQKKGHRPIKI